jgi:hypothetical protein
MVGSFVLMQIGFLAVVDVWFPFLYDPEAILRFRDLRKLHRDEPDRPMLLLFGSSRTTMSFRPEVLGKLGTGSGPEPLVYNFSHLGGTPAFSAMTLQRLLKFDLRPRWVVTEIMLPLMSFDTAGLVPRMGVSTEYPMIFRHSTAKRILREHCMTRLIPWHRNRTSFLLEVAPGWVDEETRRFRGSLAMAPFGWDHSFVTKKMTAEDIHREKVAAQMDYGPHLREFHIEEWLTRGFDEMADLCRREGIGLTFVVTPESKEYRGWYAPGSDRIIRDFCDDLSRRTGVSIVDGRDWVPDEELYDGHHATARGADIFTKRLEQEVLRPLIRSKDSEIRVTPVSRTR